MKSLNVSFSATFLLIVAYINLFAQSENRASLNVSNLKCENLVNPLGIDLSSPQLSWELNAPSRNQKQSAYQIVVSNQETELEKDRGNYWDSGKTPSNQTANISYQGKSLSSRLKLFWKVRVWDASGKPSAWSPVSSWEMGFLNSSDWQAKWIGMGEDQFPDSAGTGPAPYFRKAFRMDAKMVSARIRVCGLGFYELVLN